MYYLSSKGTRPCLLPQLASVILEKHIEIPPLIALISTLVVVWAMLEAMVTFHSIA